MTASSAAYSIANGITTALHALTVSWEPGLRSREGTRALRRAITGHKELPRVITRQSIGGAVGRRPGDRR